jgi:GNAT superfamily N-acetyltransferase
VIRAATTTDGPALAALHWTSWRTHYRQILPPDFVDGALGGHIAAIWLARFASEPAPPLILLDARSDGPTGFVAGFAEPPLLYIDNLHAAPALRGQGIGRALLAAVARRGLSMGLTGAYLWVLDGNAPAFRFYDRLGGQQTQRQVESFWGHKTAETRYDWDDLGALAAACAA